MPPTRLLSSFAFMQQAAACFEVFPATCVIVSFIYGIDDSDFSSLSSIRFAACEEKNFLLASCGISDAALFVDIFLMYSSGALGCCIPCLKVEAYLHNWE